MKSEPKAFDLLETTIADIQSALQEGDLSARELVQLYLNRIDAYDQRGPTINSVITINPRVLDEADQLDATLRTSGPAGPLHGVPVMLKDGTARIVQEYVW